MKARSCSGVDAGLASQAWQDFVRSRQADVALKNLAGGWWPARVLRAVPSHNQPPPNGHLHVFRTIQAGKRSRECTFERDSRERITKWKLCMPFGLAAPTYCYLSAKPEIDDTTLRGLNGQNLRGFAQGFSMIVLVLQAFHGTIWAMLKLAATFAGLYVGVSSNWLIDPLSVGGKGKQGGHLRVWKTPKLPLHNLPSFRFVSLRL